MIAAAALAFLSEVLILFLILVFWSLMSYCFDAESSY